jgi:hypothetical protein
MPASEETKTYSWGCEIDMTEAIAAACAVIVLRPGVYGLLP